MKTQATEKAKKVMTRAWQIRKAAAQECGCKVSEIIFSECLRMAWSQAKSVFTATSQKTGSVFVVGDREVRYIATKEGRFYCIEITAEEKRQNGFDVSQKVMFKLDDQAGYDAYKKQIAHIDFYTREYETMQTLEGQRAALKASVENMYSEENFPGSRAYNLYIAAEKKLAEFDAQYPQVKAAALKVAEERNARKFADHDVWV